MKRDTVSLTRRLAHPEAMERLGQQIASQLPESVVIFLKGPLGAGKTTFVRGFIRSLGVTGSIKSPTYTLVETYETRIGPILHFDLYRLNHASELEYIGIRDYTEKPAIWLVEWPEKAAVHHEITVLPLPDLTLSFDMGADAHQVQLTSNTLLGCQLLKHLVNTINY